MVRLGQVGRRGLGRGAECLDRCRLSFGLTLKLAALACHGGGDGFSDGLDESEERFSLGTAFQVSPIWPGG